MKHFKMQAASLEVCILLTLHQKLRWGSSSYSTPFPLFWTGRPELKATFKSDFRVEFHTNFSNLLIVYCIYENPKWILFSGDSQNLHRIYIIRKICFRQNVTNLSFGNKTYLFCENGIKLFFKYFFTN